MKRLLSLLLCALLLLGMMIGCAKQEETEPAPTEASEDSAPTEDVASEEDVSESEETEPVPDEYTLEPASVLARCTPHHPPAFSVSFASSQILASGHISSFSYPRSYLARSSGALGWYLPFQPVTYPAACFSAPWMP